MSLSRMEANIHVFSEQQRQKRKQELLKAFEEHTLVITPHDLEGKDSKLFAKSSEACTICLAAYQVGNVVVRSSNASCQHLFHQECIASWLMTRQSPLCPCCRQTFIHDLYKRAPSTSSLSDDDSSQVPTSNYSSGESGQGHDGTSDAEPAAASSLPFSTGSDIATAGEEAPVPALSTGKAIQGQPVSSVDEPAATLLASASRNESTAEGEQPLSN